MGQFTEIKKEDIGFKFASGILSSDATAIDWFAEKLGLSPNQLPADIWMEEVPEAENYAAAFSISENANYPQITRRDQVILKKVANVNDTLWMAVDSSGNRMRNFINPSNHQLTNPTNPNDKGSASIGYQIMLYQVNSSTNNTSTQINLTDGTWMFYYKEGILACSEVETPAIMGWSTGSNNDTLHASLFQYTGVNLLPSNSPDHGQVLAYNDPGGTDPSFTWVDNSGGSGGGSGVVTDNDYGDISVSSSGALWTIDTSAVSYGKIQDVTAGERMLGRKASTSGPIEEFSATEVRSFVGLPETVNGDGYYADLTPDWVPSVDPGYITQGETEINNLDVNQGGAVTWGNVIVPSYNVNGSYSHIHTLSNGGPNGVSAIDFIKGGKSIYLAANGSQEEIGGDGTNDGPQNIVDNATSVVYLDAPMNMWTTSTSANLGESGAGKDSWANLYLEKGGDVEWYGGSAYIRHNDSLQADNSLVDDLDIRARGSLNLSIGDHNNTTVTSLNLTNSASESLLRISENSGTYTFYQGNPLTSQSGGTGHGSYSTGDILYCEFGNSSDLVKLPVGVVGDIMYVGTNSSGDPVPIWDSAGAFYSWKIQDGSSTFQISNDNHIELVGDTNVFATIVDGQGTQADPLLVKLGLNSTIDVTNSGTASNVTGVVAIANGGTGADNAADARTNLGVDAAGVDNSTNVTLSGADYLSISGQDINAGSINLSNSLHIGGVLPTLSGGTGYNTFSEGDILYGTSDITLNKLSIGNENDILQVSSSGVPTWTAANTITQDTNIAENNLQLTANREMNFPFGRELRFHSGDSSAGKFNVEIESSFSGKFNVSSQFNFKNSTDKTFKIYDPDTIGGSVVDEYYASITPKSFNDNRDFNLPNRSGTIAITDDLNNFVSVGDTDVNISITGNAGGISGILPTGQGGTGNDSWDAYSLVHVNDVGTALTNTTLVSFEGGYININRMPSGSGYVPGMILFEDGSATNQMLMSQASNNGSLIYLPSETGTLALTTDTVAGAEEVVCDEIIPRLDINYPIVLGQDPSPSINDTNNIHHTNNLLYNPVDDRLRGFANLLLENKVDDATGADIHFHSDRNGGALQDDDVIGKLRFNGVNGDSIAKKFAEIIVTAKDITGSSEEGIIDFKIATSGAGNPLISALKLQSMAAGSTVNVDIGGNANDEVSITGSLDVGQGFILNSSSEIASILESGDTFANDDLSLMTSAAIDDHILSKNYMDNFIMLDSSDVSKSIGEADYVKITSSTGANGTSWSGSGTVGDPWVLDIASPNDSTTATAGDGIDITNDEFSVDLKANGGLVIESAKLAVDLGASDITGELDISKLGSTNWNGGTAGGILTCDNVNSGLVWKSGAANQILKTNPVAAGLVQWVDDPTAIGIGVIPKGTGTAIEDSGIEIDDQTTYSAIEPVGTSPETGLKLITNDFLSSAANTAVGIDIKTGSRNQQASSHQNAQISGDINIESGFLKGNTVLNATGDVLTTGAINITSGLINETGTYGTATLTTGDINIDAGACDTEGSNTATQGKIKIGNSTKEVEIGQGSNANSSISLGGNVTKIGMGAHTDGYFLKWNDTAGHTEWAAGAGGGATVNNEMNNRLVTSTGSGGNLDAEAELTYDSNELTIGDATDSRAIITRARPAIGNDGGTLTVTGAPAKGTDLTGGNVELMAGAGSGDGTSGKIAFYTHAANSSNSGTTTNGSVVEVAKITERGDLELVTTGCFRGGNIGTIYKDGIYLMPTDFMHADTNKVAEINDNGGSITAGATDKYYATVQVPSGYKATHVHVYGSAGSQTERVYYYQSTVAGNGSSTLMGTNTFGYVNTQTTLDTPFVGSAGRYMVVQWKPVNTTNKLYGAVVTITSTI